MGWGRFKPLLAEATVAALEPIQNRYKELIDDRAELGSVLKDGADRANTVAEATVDRVRNSLGFLANT